MGLCILFVLEFVGCLATCVWFVSCFGLGLGILVFVFPLGFAGVFGFDGVCVGYTVVSSLGWGCLSLFGFAIWGIMVLWF